MQQRRGGGPQRAGASRRRDLVKAQVEVVHDLDDFCVPVPERCYEIVGGEDLTIVRIRLRRQTTASGGPRESGEIVKRHVGRVGHGKHGRDTAYSPHTVADYYAVAPGVALLNVCEVKRR